MISKEKSLGTKYLDDQGKKETLLVLPVEFSSATLLKIISNLVKTIPDPETLKPWQ